MKQLRISILDHLYKINNLLRINLLRNEKLEKSREVDMVRLSLLSEPRRRKVKFEDQKIQKAEAEQNSQPQTHRPISDRIMARESID